MSDRVVVGDTIRLTNTFKVDGTATDPTTITLAVTDPAANTDTYTYALTTVSKSATGVYYKDVTVDEDGPWTYVWTGTGTAADITEGTLTVHPLAADALDVLTLLEAKTAVGLAQTNSDSDDRLRQAVTAVSSQLDQLCGPVRNRTVTETHDGGTPTIRLRRVPVYSITTLTEYSNTAAQVLTAETNASKPGYGYLHDGQAGTIVSGTIRRRGSNSDLCFTAGRRNIEAVYLAGRAANTEVVGAKFKEAAAMMLRNIWTSEMASGTETFNAFAEQGFNPLLGPGMLNKVSAMLTGELLDGVYVG